MDAEALKIVSTPLLECRVETDVLGPLDGPTSSSSFTGALIVLELYFGGGKDEVLCAAYLAGVTLGLARKNGDSGALSR